MPMQPFDKHDADTAGLESCGSTLVNKAAEGLTNGKLTKAAYSPAIDSVRGDCAPQVQTADHALQQRSGEVTGQVAWAAVVSRFWGSQITAFNRRVDKIRPAAGVQLSPEERRKAEHDWWNAYNTYIADGRTTTASMLRDGPTEGHMQTAIDVGVMPPMTWDWGTPGEYWNGFKAIWLPPTDGTWVDTGIWAGKLGSLSVIWGDSWYRSYFSKRFAPRGPNGRFVKYKGTPWTKRFRQGMSNRNWVSKPRTAATKAKWAKYAKIAANRVFYPLSFASGTYDQWQRDANRADLSTGERVTRSATRGAIKAAGMYAGIEGGAWAGAAIGTAIGGPVGTAVGGMIGGLVGGVVGSGLADEVADFAVEAVTDPVETLENVGDALTFWD